MIILHESMGPGRDRTRDPWNCSQTRICSQTHYRLHYAARHEYFLVLFMKIDKVVTIYSKFRFDYHKGKQSGMVNALLSLKKSLFSNPLWYFQNTKTCKVFVPYCYNIKEEFCLKISDSLRFISQNEYKLWTCKEWHVIL